MKLKFTFRNLNFTPKYKFCQQTPKSHSKYTQYLPIGALFLTTSYILYKLNFIQAQYRKAEQVKISHNGKSNIGGNWSLIDTNNQQISQKDLFG